MVTCESRMATRPPRHSAPQISKTEASNAAGASWATVWPGRTAMRDSRSIRPTTLAWSTTTPFGRPVEPDV